MRNINNYKIFGTILLIIVIISIVSQFIFADDGKINYDNHKIALNLLKENKEIEITFDDQKGTPHLMRNFKYNSKLGKVQALLR